MSPRPDPRAQTNRELRWFVLAAFLPTILLAALAAARGGLAAFPAAALAMFTPMLGAMLVQRFVVKQPLFRGGQLGFRLGRFKWWLMAPALFGALVALAFVVSFLWQPGLLVNGSVLAANVANLRGIPDVGDSFESRLGTALALTLILGPLLNIPLFLGEEVGWRGFMTPRLIALHGRRGIILAGLIWGLWHTPLIVLGHNYPEHPWLGHLVWLPLCICMSIVLQAVYAAGRSIFVPALAHGAINQIAGLGFAILIVDAEFVDWLYGPAGLAGLAAFAGPAAWIYFRRPDLLGSATSDRLIASSSTPVAQD